MSKTTAEKVIQIIADHLDIAPELITPESRFDEDLGCDSLDEIELVTCIEEEFGIELHDDALEGIKTVVQAVELVDKSQREFA